MNKQLRCLLVYRNCISFVRNDYYVLKEKFQTEGFQFKSLFGIIRLFIKIRKVDLSFVWFANIWCFLTVIFSKILNKKVIVVAGGYDVANVPEINYGLTRKPFLRQMVNYSLSNADAIIAVSEINMGEIQAITSNKNVHLIYNCFNLKEPSQEVVKDAHMVITVGNIKWDNLKRKGIELTIHTARYLPDMNFYIIGNHSDDSIEYLRSIAPRNVHFPGRVTDDELYSYMMRSKYYIQPSFHEAFGVSVVEAMFFNCIPIVSNRGALPEIIGNEGIVVEELSPASFANAIVSCEERNEVGGGRKWVIDNYSYEQRKDKLINLCNELLNT